MGFDFLTDLSNMQVEIPPEVSRLAGFFVLLQGGMIYLQKKNNPAKDIWEDLSWVFLGGLFVYLFPELIRFMETLVNALMPLEFPGIKNRGIKKCKAKDNQIIIHFSSVPLF